MQRRLLLHLVLGQFPPFDAEEVSRAKSSPTHDDAADDDDVSKDDHGLRRCIEQWEPTFYILPRQLKASSVQQLVCFLPTTPCSEHLHRGDLYRLSSDQAFAAVTVKKYVTSRIQEHGLSTGWSAYNPAVKLFKLPRQLKAPSQKKRV